MSTVPCPNCGQQIHPLASKCKHCKASLQPAPVETAPLPSALPELQDTEVPETGVTTRPQAEAKEVGKWSLALLLAAVFLLGVCAGVLYQQSRGEPTTGSAPPTAQK